MEVQINFRRFSYVQHQSGMWKEPNTQDTKAATQRVPKFSDHYYNMNSQTLLYLFQFFSKTQNVVVDLRSFEDL
jgi:hypothetical protein